MMLMRYYFLIFFIKAYVVDNHLNCFDLSMSSHNIYFYKEVEKTFKKFTGCHLKTTKLLDCALIGACVIIRLNTVFKF